MKRIVEHTDTAVAQRAKEYLLYGSSRLGTAYADNANGGAAVSGAPYGRVVGKKQYELSDHLGNVRATVGDVKVRSGSTFAARVESFTEYFAFGMEAKSGGSGGRFGFNGYEKADEVAEGKYSADYREYDSRVAQFDEEVKELIKSEIIYDLIYESDLLGKSMTSRTRDVEGLSMLEEGTRGFIFAEDFNRITMVVGVVRNVDSDLTLARVLHEFKYMHQYEKRQKGEII